jgi:hypothetical protein
MHILKMPTQPDDETCGPTSLYAIYRYYGLDISLSAVISSVKRTKNGGTIAGLLALDALSRGFNTTIYINNLMMFDPSWFKKGEADSCFLIEKLKAQKKVKKHRRIQETSKIAIDYLKSGGIYRFKTITTLLLNKYFEQKIPILTGLSSTYLYDSPRECFHEKGLSTFDDIKGEPCGHFVVLLGHDEQGRSIVVADPHQENPLSTDNYYHVSSQRLINAIMLGVMTYDATLLIIEPKAKGDNGYDNCHG